MIDREYYNNLNEAYLQMSENTDKSGKKDREQQTGRDAYDAAEPHVKNLKNIAGTVLKKGTEAVSDTLSAYNRGVRGKKVSSKSGLHNRAANQAGRNLRWGTGTLATHAANALDSAKNITTGAIKQGLGIKEEEIVALLNSPHMTEDDIERFLALIEQISDADKAKLKERDAHRQSVIDKQPPIKKPLAHAVGQMAKFGDRLNVKGSRPNRIKDGVKAIFGKEEAMLQAMTDELFEGLPEPKRNYLKDMDPYDPRRSPRDHAPGAPLPPPRPGIPEFYRRAASKAKDKKDKTA